MKATHFLIAAVCFVAAVTSCKEKNLPFVKSLEEADYVASAKELLPSAELTDSLSYLMGTQAGADIVYSFGELSLERIDKAVEDFGKISFDDFETAAKSNFTDSTADAVLPAFEINPGLLGPVLNKYAAARHQEEGEDLEVSETLADSASYLYGILTGYRVAGMKLEYARIRKGMEDFIRLDTAEQFRNYMTTREMTDEYKAYAEQFEIAPETFQSVSQAVQQANRAARIENYKVQSKTFFEKAQDVKGFECKNVQIDSTLSSKIVYRMDKKGSGAKVAYGDSFTVEYKGMHIDESVFDEGSFPVNDFSEHGLIRGFTEALLLLSDGGKMTVVIPFDLAYGEQGSYSWYTGEYSIYPFETLVFELGVKDLVKPEPVAEETPAEVVPAEEAPAEEPVVIE